MSDPRRVLVLGGTAEARSLCAALAPDEQRRIQERASRLIAAFEPIEPLAPLAELPRAC